MSGGVLHALNIAASCAVILLRSTRRWLTLLLPASLRWLPSISEAWHLQSVCCAATAGGCACCRPCCCLPASARCRPSLTVFGYTEKGILVQHHAMWQSRAVKQQSTGRRTLLCTHTKPPPHCPKMTCTQFLCPDKHQRVCVDPVCNAAPVHNDDPEGGQWVEYWHRDTRQLIRLQQPHTHESALTCSHRNAHTLRLLLLGCLWEKTGKWHHVGAHGTPLLP